MYKRFFGLHSNPFNVNPDPRFLFLTPSAQESLASLAYGIEKRKGFVLLTGEVGTGKTTLLNRLLDWLHRRRVATAFIFNSRLSVPQFFDLMMADFGLDSGSMEKSRMLMRLNAWLLERHRVKETAVVVVDEAQSLSTEVLEEIRLLTNLETSTDKLLQIVLSGQPELDEKLKLPQLRQLNQRITLRCRTQTLSEAETDTYVRSRLTIAGCTRKIFLPAAAHAIFRHTRGIPRLVNVLCEHSLISAYVDRQEQIGSEVIDRVARDLEIDATASLNVKQTDSFNSDGDGNAMMTAVLGQLYSLNERIRGFSAKTVLKGGE